MSDYQKLNLGRSTVSPTEPKAHIRTSGHIYFNNPATDEWFSDVKEVTFYTVPGEQVLCLALGESSEDSRKVNHSKDSGVEVNAAAALRAMGCNPEGMSDIAKVTPEWDGAARLESGRLSEAPETADRREIGLLKLDLSDVDFRVWECRADGCEESFTTERGRDVHEGKAHGGALG